jgi:hypothetical protein
MAIEDAWVLGQHIGRQLAEGNLDWDGVLTAYNAVRPEHCRRVITTARAWGDFWHITPGPKRAWRNQVLLDRDEHDYSFLDWLYGPTPLTPRRNRRCSPRSRTTRSLPAPDATLNGLPDCVAVSSHCAGCPRSGECEIITVPDRTDRHIQRGGQL